MSNRRAPVIWGTLLVAIALAAAAYAGYRHGRHGAMGTGAQPTAASQPAAAAGSAQQPGDVDPATGKRVLYWHDPMVPGQRFDRPGKSPFMDMMLVPVYADEDAGEAGGVKINPRVQQNLGIRTAEVTMTEVAPSVEAVGTITYNERDQVVVQARATGYIEKLHVRATLDRVASGQPLAEIYVPDWVAAQEEFLAVRRLLQGSAGTELIDAARQRMRLLGMSDAQIRAVETIGERQPRLTLTAPLAGVITEIAAREGMTVMAGATLFRINGVRTVWANVEVPEGQAALVQRGASIEARSPALPGTTLQGRVQAILPHVESSTRTVRARVELANPGMRLMPGMTVNVSLGAKRRQVLTVPSDAVIQTGKRVVVMLAEADGRFRPSEVQIGLESGGRTEIRKGLEAGQTVVVSGQFLIDSESSLRALESRAQHPQPATDASTRVTAEHSGRGRIESLGPDGVTISHEPIPSLQWGPMTMEFGAPPGGLPPGLKAGQDVAFAFRMDKDRPPVLTRIGPEPGAGGMSRREVSK